MRDDHIRSNVKQVVQGCFCKTLEAARHLQVGVFAPVDCRFLYVISQLTVFIFGGKKPVLLYWRFSQDGGMSQVHCIVIVS